MEAVNLIADGKAPRIPQPEEGATYEGIQKKENAEVVWSNTVGFFVGFSYPFFLFFSSLY